MPPQPLGVGKEISYWKLLPVWSHLVFLALLVRGNLLGGWMRVTQRLERTLRKEDRRLAARAAGSADYDDLHPRSEPGGLAVRSPADTL